MIYNSHLVSEWDDRQEFYQIRIKLKKFVSKIIRTGTKYGTIRALVQHHRHCSISVINLLTILLNIVL